MIYLQLFFEFFQIGLFAIGGGLATLPFLERLSERTGWYTLADLANMIAISEATPGPIGINMATYTGFHVGGVLGAVIATLGVIFPATVIVLIVARFLQRFSKSMLVQDVFYGLRPASVGLICSAALSVLLISLLNGEAFRATGQLLKLFDWKSIVLAVALYLAMNKWKLHPALYIAIAAVVGIVFRFAH
ncbi:MAG: chromate transporter [Clostridiales bacterium]|nr:chromate transporter [Clostridiales bacterium]